ncbi:U3 small nucleolar RNA-associated protein 22 [Plasmodiophora brassicae]
MAANADEETHVAATMALAVEELVQAMQLPACISRNVQKHCDRIAELLAEADRSVLSVAANDTVLGVTASRDVSFEFMPPDGVRAVGSCPLRTTPASRPLVLDVLLDLPAAIFQAKDYLDRRVHVRRALYLQHAQQTLSSCYHVTVADDPLLPSLTLTCLLPSPFAPIGQRPLTAIRILTGLPRDLFIPRRIAPQRNAIRQPDPTLPTPAYNQTVLHMQFAGEHVAFLTDRHERCPGLAEAGCLTRIWMAHRHLLRDQRYKSVTGFAIDCLLAYLFDTGRIIGAMSPFQMFRALLTFLRDTPDLAVAVGAVNDDEGYALSQFQAAFPVTLVGPCGRCNLLYDVSRITYDRIRHEADVTLQSATFANTFLTPVPSHLKFDARVRVRCADADPERVHAVLSQAYTDRVTFVDVVDVSQGCIDIGLLLNASEASRDMDKGPATTDVNGSAQFRQFWGAPAELRRFRDGSIMETVVWNRDSNDQHHSSVLLEIARHILHRHVGIVSDQVMLTSSRDLDGVVALNKVAPGEHDASVVHGAFQRLSETLRSLEDLPLTVRTITCSHPSMRQTWPVPIEAVNEHADVDPMVFHDMLPVVVQFESSSRWPEDLSAIARIKSAVHIRMAATLQEQGVPATAFLMATLCWIDGVAFRVEIFHAREIAIRRAERDFPGVSKTIDPDANARDLVVMERDLVQLPLIGSDLRALTQRYPVMAQTCRLARRWLAAHQVDPWMMSEVAIDLTVAYVFLHPAPFVVPSSSLCGFLRWLTLLTSFDWANSVLVVDFHGDLTMEQRQKMEESLARKDIAMRIGTYRDVSASMWATPPAAELARIVRLASSSLSHLMALVESSEPVPSSSWKTTFRTPTSRADLVINLNRHFVPYPDDTLFPAKKEAKRVAKRFKAAVPSAETVRKRIQQLSAGVNAVELLVGDLRAAFDGVATFRYDRFGGDVVVGVLDARVKGAQRRIRSRTSLAYMQPAPGDGERVELNADQVAYDIRRLGDGIVTQVVVARSTRQ